MRARRLRRSAAMLAAVIALAAVAVAASAAGVSDRTTGGALRLELRLPARTFPANGLSIDAHLKISNHTGRPVVIPDACDGWVQVELVSGPQSSELPRLGAICASERIRRGITLVPIQISTTFSECQQGHRPATSATPHCLGPDDSRSPNLAPGTYRAEVMLAPASARPTLPKPLTVTLAQTR